MHIKSSFPDPPKVPDCNAYQVLWNRPEQAKWPEHFTLYVDGKTGEKRTYQEFRTRVLKAATALGTFLSDGELSIKNKSREMIAIISSNSLDYAVLVHSLIFLATPFAMIPAYLTPFEIERALKLTKPSRLFVEDKLVHMLTPVVRKIGLGEQDIFILGEKIEGRRGFEEMVEAANLPMHPIPSRVATRNTLAYLMFSSGTTGPPKAVMISHENIIAFVYKLKIVGSVIGYSSGRTRQHEIPVHFVRVPITQSSGFHPFCFYPSIAPITCVISNDRGIEAALEIIARYKVTAARFDPAFIQQLVNYPRLKDIDLSSLQLVMSSGSYFSPDALPKMAAAIPHQFYFGQAYAMTESPEVAILQPQPIISGDTDPHMIESTGILYPGMEARTLKEDGSEADVNEPGELYVRGGSVALGYWRDEKATQEKFIHGWLRTGDRFRIDESGRLLFSDRVKDTFKTLGTSVSPIEIEEILYSEPRRLITDVVVAGVSTGRGPEDKIARAWIVLSDRGKELGAEATIRELEIWYQRRLSQFKWLHGGIEIVNEIPKGASGKPLRRVLQSKYEEGTTKRTRSIGVGAHL